MMEIWASKARTPVEHQVATETLTFIYRDHDVDIFSDLGNPGRSRLYRVRLRQAKKHKTARLLLQMEEIRKATQHVS